MTSAYSIRKKVSPKTPDLKPQLFKIFERNTTKSKCCRENSSKKKQINAGKSARKLTSTPILTQSHIEIKASSVSEPQVKQQDHQNISVNQSKGYHDKCMVNQRYPEIPGSLSSEAGNYQQNQILQVCKQKQKKNNSVNQYCSYKKSYRNHFHDIDMCIPYRKCHSAPEQKIVNIINKMKAKKQCYKQIETFADRAKKVSTKELSNPFFVSGLVTIRKLVAKQSHLEGNRCLMQKMDAAIEEVKNRIYDQLDCIKYFESELCLKMERKDCYDKGVLIRKAYRVLKKKKSYSKERMKEQTIKITQNFLSSETKNLALFWGELTKL